VQEHENTLLSIKYINSNRKFFKSIFSYYFLPAFVILNLINLNILLTYEHIQDLNAPFTLSVLGLVLLAIILFPILMFSCSMFFLKKRYYSLSIFQNYILINSKNKYELEDIEYVSMRYNSIVSHRFSLRKKKSKKLIGHFVYRFYDTYLFNSSPEIIKSIIELRHIDNKELIEKSIQDDRTSCLSKETRNEKIRKITIFLFFALIAEVFAMLYLIT